MTGKQHTVLSISNLSIGYQTKKAKTVVASNINIELHSGQLIGLVGANGIGKSTLIRTLTNVQTSLDGTIQINNKPIEQYSNIELAKVLSLVLTESVVSKNYPFLSL